MNGGGARAGRVSSRDVGSLGLSPTCSFGSAGWGSRSARSNNLGGITGGIIQSRIRISDLGGRAGRPFPVRASRRRGHRIPAAARPGRRDAAVPSPLSTFPVPSLNLSLYIFFRRHLSGSHHLVSLHPRCTPYVPRDARASRGAVARRPVASRLLSGRRYTRGLAFRSWILYPGTVLPTFAFGLEVCGHATWPEALLPAAIACGSSLGDQAPLHTASGTVDTPQDELNLHACFLSRPCARDVLRR
jgi:hypothetical protein